MAAQVILMSALTTKPYLNAKVKDTFPELVQTKLRVPRVELLNEIKLGNLVSPVESTTDLLRKLSASPADSVWDIFWFPPQALLLQHHELAEALPPSLFASQEKAN